MTIDFRAGAYTAAGAFFVLRAVPLLKSALGVFSTNGNGGKTEFYLEQIARNTETMRDSLVGLTAKFEAHDKATLDGLRDLREGQ